MYASLALSLSDGGTRSTKLEGEIVKWPTEGESLQGVWTKTITRDGKGATDVHRKQKCLE